MFFCTQMTGEDAYKATKDMQRTARKSPWSPQSRHANASLLGRELRSPKNMYRNACKGIYTTRIVREFFFVFRGQMKKRTPWKEIITHEDAEKLSLEASAHLPEKRRSILSTVGRPTYSSLICFFSSATLAPQFTVKGQSGVVPPAFLITTLKTSPVMAGTKGFYRYEFVGCKKSRRCAACLSVGLSVFLSAVVCLPFCPSVAFFLFCDVTARNGQMK